MENIASLRKSRGELRVHWNWLTWVPHVQICNAGVMEHFCNRSGLYNQKVRKTLFNPFDATWLLSSTAELAENDRSPTSPSSLLFYHTGPDCHCIRSQRPLRMAVEYAFLLGWAGGHFWLCGQLHSTPYSNTELFSEEVILHCPYFNLH